MMGTCCALFYPTILNMSSFLHGMKSDNFAVLRWLWQLEQDGDHLSCYSNFSLGGSLPVKPPEFLSSFPTPWVTSMANEVFAFNFILFLSFLLSGLFTYALVYVITKRIIPSTLCGLAYMILPYHLAMSQYHFSLARVEIFPLFLLALVWFLRRPTWYTATSILIVQFASFAIDPHYGLFNLLILVIYSLVYLFHHRTKGWSRPTITRVSMLLSLVILAGATGVPRFLRIFEGRAEFVLNKPLEQLYAYSARPWDYLLPSIQHPLFGRFTSGFIMSHIHDSYWHEQTLYLGWCMIILAVVGVWHLWRSTRPEHRFWGVFLPILAIGGFAFSMPPTVRILGTQIPMPGYFLHQVLPMFRVYARFGIVVATALIPLAGFGLAWVIERVRWKKTVVCILGGLILFEFLPPIPFPTVDLSDPPDVYEWLAEQTEVEAIVEYPLNWPAVKEGEHLNLWDLYEYMVWQRVHEKPMFNGEPEIQLDLAMKLVLQDPAESNTPVRLGWLGITHMVIHKESFEIATLESLVRNPDIEVVYTDEEATVFRIRGERAHFTPESFRFPPNVGVSVKTDDPDFVVLQVDEMPEGEEQLLIYGPYLALPQGRYSAQFQLLSLLEGENDVHLMVVLQSGRTTLAEENVDLRVESNPSLSFETDGASDIEFRVLGRASIQFGGVIVRKIE
jgi:hypothetical protein